MVVISADSVFGVAAFGFTPFLWSFRGAKIETNKTQQKDTAIRKVGDAILKVTEKRFVKDTAKRFFVFLGERFFVVYMECFLCFFKKRFLWFIWSVFLCFNRDPSCHFPFNRFAFGCDACFFF